MTSVIDRDRKVAAQFDDPRAVDAYVESHTGQGRNARFYRSRMALVSRVLESCPGGELLDVGCGPGMMVRHLTRTRPRDFDVSALDRSPAMVRACLRHAQGNEAVNGVVGRVESIPFGSAEFDVVLAMGVLEYTEIDLALAEIARVTKPGGLTVVTMLNPTSPYRFVQFHVFWPLLRALRTLETWLGVPPHKRHGRYEHGVTAYRERLLRSKLDAVGLRPVRSGYVDPTLLVPPADRFLPRSRRPAAAVVPVRGWRKPLCTGYLIAARRRA